MTDFVPPLGPPPPKIPEGWKAVWNDQYSEWFFVNIYTKKSQWDKPTSPVYPPGEIPPDVPPSSYAPPVSGSVPTEKSVLGTNNPFGDVRKSAEMIADERLARELQDKENARQGAIPQGYGYNNQQQQQQQQYEQSTYQNQPYQNQGQSSYQSQSPYAGPISQNKEKSKGGFLGKLLGKVSGSSNKAHGYAQQQYPQQGPYYGGQSGYGHQVMHSQPGRKQPGMGMGGAAALGVGGGLLGGALLGGALADAGDHGGDGGDYGGDGGDYGGDGGDYGGDGGDFGGGGGGDFGGDGGGDFGGGDF